MHRNDYNKKINELLKQFKITYDGNGSKKVSTSFFELLEGIDSQTGKKRVELAIRRAERNYDNCNHFNPANEESSTTVFKLVSKLLKYI